MESSEASLEEQDRTIMEMMVTLGSTQHKWKAGIEDIRIFCNAIHASVTFFKNKKKYTNSELCKPTMSSQSLPPGRFHKPLILMHQRADWMKTKIRENYLNWSHGPQPCLTQWNYEPLRVGPPKTDGSWWRVLTKCGPLEKGIANHFSILTLRTPWTVWKGKKMGQWKMNFPGR